MERKISPTVVATLEELRQRFEAWRCSGAKGRRIPEELWDSATELAREIGVNPVVRALRLNYTRLKRRVTGQVTPKPSPTTTRPAFVELAMEAISQRPECMVEFEGRRGKVSIRLIGHNPVDLMVLVETLSRAER